MKGFVQTFANCPEGSRKVRNEMIFIPQKDIKTIEELSWSDVEKRYKGIDDPDCDFVFVCTTKEKMVYLMDAYIAMSDPMEQTNEHLKDIGKMLDATNKHLKDIADDLEELRDVVYDDSNLVEAIESVTKKLKK